MGGGANIIGIKLAVMSKCSTRKANRVPECGRHHGMGWLSIGNTKKHAEGKRLPRLYLDQVDCRGLIGWAGVKLPIK